MLDLVVLTWLLALATSTSLFAVVVLFQVLTRRLRVAARRARRVADESTAAGQTSGASAAQAA